MKFILSCLIAATVLTSVAQDLSVTGTVTDKTTNQPISGALIKVVETGESTYSDDKGEFRIAVKDGYENLSITAEGYAAQQVFVQGRGQITVSLEQSTASSPSKLADSQLSSAQLGTQPVTDLEQTTQGRVAGVFVQNSGGKLGQGASVRIRGGSSLVGSNDPLYVVDGVPLTSGNQSSIDPSSIESMEIIKDASGMALYGSRAANGVVIITTKKGASGKLKVDLEYQMGVGQTPKKLPMMSKDDYNILNLEYTLRAILAGLPDPDITLTPTSTLENYISYENLKQWYADLDALRPSSTDGTISYTLPSGDIITMSTQSPIFRFNYDTDWQDEAFRTAISNRANVNLSGGSSDQQAFVNLNYMDQEGILIGNDYQRFGARVNVNSNWTEKLSSALSLGYVRTNENRLNEDGDDGNPVQMALLPPGDASDPTNGYRLFVRSNEYNPETEVYGSKNFETSDRINGTLSASYQLAEKLSLDVDGGIDILDLEDRRRQGPFTQAGTPTGFSQLSTTKIFNYLVNGSLNYSKSLNKSNLDAVAGVSYQESTGDITYRSARLNSIPTLRRLDEGDPSLVNNPIAGSYSAFLSYFGALNYTVLDRYTLNASVRTDGSSKFGEDNQYGIFPAASASWTISKEAFLEGVGFIDFLQLSAGYGVLGNTPNEDFLYKTNYFTVTYGDDTLGLRAANYANSSLKWESTGQLDASLDFAVLNERISGSFGYYNRKTTDLLFPTPITLTSGFTSAIKNSASLTNSGMEFSLTTKNVASKSVNWETSFNISTNKNKVSDIGGEPMIAGVSAFIEGQPAGVFYLPEYLGVEQATGEAQYDFGGLVTTDYNLAFTSSRKVMGNPNPKYYGGLTNSISYKFIDLNFVIQFVSGVDAYYETGEIIANSGYGLYNQFEDQNKRWFNAADPAEFPVLNPGLASPNSSSRWIVDASYARLKSLTLSVNLAEFLGQRLNLSQFSFYIGGQNLYTITKYPGYDPDVSYSDPDGGDLAANINKGIDFFTAPQPRIYTTGIKIGF